MKYIYTLGQPPGMMKYKHIWTKCNEHGMIIIDQNVDTNDKGRTFSLQTGI